MDIEKAIKILEKFKNNEMQRDKLERDSRCGGWKIGDIYKKLELNIAIEHILAEREELKSEIQHKCEQIFLTDREIDKRYISKQKVLDKIQERKFELQQEYKEFENDEILKRYKELLEDK